MTRWWEMIFGAVAGVLIAASVWVALSGGDAEPALVSESATVSDTNLGTNGSGSGSNSDQPGSSSTAVTNGAGSATVETPTPPSASGGTGPTCVDDTGSWNWPTTTDGPVVNCPGNPYGLPDYPLATLDPGWIAVLDSVEIWEVEQANTAMAVLTRMTDARLLDSRMYRGLRDPYWVAFVGPFPSHEEASSFCKSNSHLFTCYPREIL